MKSCLSCRHRKTVLNHAELRRPCLSCKKHSSWRPKKAERKRKFIVFEDEFSSEFRKETAV